MEQKPSTKISINSQMIMRANMVGLSLFIVFGVSAVILYLILGSVTNIESAVARVFIAVFVAPIIIIAIFAIYWKRNPDRIKAFAQTLSSENE